MGTEEIMELVCEYGGAKWWEACHGGHYDKMNEQASEDEAAAAYVKIEAAIAELQRVIVVLSGKLDARGQ